MGAFFLPKVALLFLAPLGPAHELLWKSFFDTAAQLAPPHMVRYMESTIPPAVQHSLQHGPGYDLMQVTHGKGVHPQSPERIPGSRTLWEIEDSQYSPHLLKQCEDEIDVVGFPGVQRLLTAGTMRMPCQQLFSTYVHTGAALPNSSLFYGRDALPIRADTRSSWGMPSLVLAGQLLMAAALRDPRNTRFVIVSGTSIPVHSPILIWSQLQSEYKSRVNACPRNDTTKYRWRKSFTTKYLKFAHWRKSAQWAVLNRAHTALVLADTHVWDQMVSHLCDGRRATLSGPDPQFPPTHMEAMRRLRHVCPNVMDEHYLPIVLATYGLDNETDCMGRATWTDWSKNGAHPTTFSRGAQLKAGLAETVRGDFKGMGNPVYPNCSQVWPKALQSAVETFMAIAKNASSQNASVASLNETVSSNVGTGALVTAAATNRRSLSSSGKASVATVAAINKLLKGVKSRAETTARRIQGTQSSSQPPLELDAAIAAWVKDTLGYKPVISACPLFARKFTGLTRGTAEGYMPPPSPTGDDLAIAIANEAAVFRWSMDCKNGLALATSCPALSPLSKLLAGSNRS